MAKSTKTKAKNKRTTTEAAAKGRQAQALTELHPVAKEVNIRLEKAVKMTADALDHRLAAALMLAKAKKKAEKAKLNFKKWADENVKYHWDNVRKLTAIGAAPNPKAAIADMREAKAKMAKTSRAKAKSDQGPRGPQASTPKVTPFDRVTQGLDAMGDKEALNFLTTEIERHRMRVLSEADAKAATKAVALGQETPIKQVKAIFDLAAPSERMVIAKWVAAAVGTELKDEFTEPDSSSSHALSVDELTTIPATLSRGNGKQRGKSRRRGA
jgi:hypothetical protein